MGILLLNICARKRRNVHDENKKKTKESIVQAQLFPTRESIHSNIFSCSCCVGKFNSYSRMTVMLEFERKEICMLRDKNLLNFVSAKHFQQTMPEKALTD